MIQLPMYCSINWSLMFQGITALATAATVVLLFLYTNYTKQMQEAVKKQAKELVHQGRLGIMPFIMIQVTESHLEVTNLGNGTAFNIRIAPAKLENLSEEDISIQVEGNIKVSIEKLPFLKPGISEPISMESATLKEKNPKIIEIVKKIYSGELAVAIITFEDIEGNTYRQDLRENLESELKRYSFPRLINIKE